jgi:hypothetical protein
MELLFENKFGLKKTKMGKSDIVYIDGPSYAYKDIVKSFQGRWNGKNKVWFWFLDKTDPNKTIETFIKPALEKINKVHGIGLEIDKLITDIEAGKFQNPETKITSEEENKIKDKLNSFKEMLMNIEEDEDFKNVMKKIIDFKAAQGYSFSFANSILIFVQNPNATIVNSKTSWEKFYKRTVNPNAKRLYIKAPANKGGIGKAAKEKIKSEYLKKLGKTDVSQLTPKENVDLKKLLFGNKFATKFEYGPVYDVSDTTQIPGTEDFIAKGKDAMRDIKWFEEDMISDEVRPIYKALVTLAETEGIKIEVLDDLKGARGVSKSGAIGILKNEGNDVGLTKTLAHEISHELLHQRYLKTKGSKFAKHHIGKDMTLETIEQQAELSAWLYMYYFGFDIKTTSLNYTVMWGGNKENMIQVFDIISYVVNDLIRESLKLIKTGAGDMNEGEDGSGVFDGEKIADLIGLGSQYDALKGKLELNERLIRRIVKK